MTINQFPIGFVPKGWTRGETLNVLKPKTPMTNGVIMLSPRIPIYGKLIEAAHVRLPYEQLANFEKWLGWWNNSYFCGGGMIRDSDGRNATPVVLQHMCDTYNDRANVADRIYHLQDTLAHYKKRMQDAEAKLATLQHFIQQGY